MRRRSRLLCAVAALFAALTLSAAHAQSPEKLILPVPQRSQMGDRLGILDPADAKQPGYQQRMTEQELLRAWGASKEPFAAFSVAPGSIGHVRPASKPSDPFWSEAATPALADAAPTPPATALADADYPSAGSAPALQGDLAASDSVPSSHGTILETLLSLLPFRRL